MKLDDQYWEQRYVDKSTAWDLGEASPPLKRFIDQIMDKNARILIPGAGSAHEAKYLLSKGFKDVTVLDYAPTPMDTLKKETRDVRLKIVQEDFFEHVGSYDIILEQTFFCALESRFRESYPKKIYELLNKSGSLMGVLFNFKAERSEPPYGGSTQEYKSLFQDRFVIEQLEPCNYSDSSRAGKELLIHFRKKIIMSTEILNHEEILHKIKRIAYQIAESYGNEDEIVLAGIADGGYIFAQMLKSMIEQIGSFRVTLCEVIIDKKRPLDLIKTSIAASDYSNKGVVLCDDVLNSGTTLIYGVRHFLNVPLSQFKTAILVNRNHKKYPVKADFKGLSLSTTLQEHINVNLREEPFNVTLS
jgi:pyrimidine operon attenuation protein/uracil phosphoribosyltransferase